jgi:hypothetical protein
VDKKLVYNKDVYMPCIVVDLYLFRQYI